MGADSLAAFSQLSLQLLRGKRCRGDVCYAVAFEADGGMRCECCHLVPGDWAWRRVVLARQPTMRDGIAHELLDKPTVIFRRLAVHPCSHVTLEASAGALRRQIHKPG